MFATVGASALASPARNSRARRAPTARASPARAIDGERARDDCVGRDVVVAARSNAPTASRRGLLAAAAAAASTLAPFSTNPFAAFAATMPDSEPTGLDPNGRLRKCPSTFNCVSTSSTGGAPEQYGVAWTASTATLDDAVAQITAAVFRACPDARRVESFATDQGNRYLRFATAGKLGEDNVEILIKNEGLGDRGWEGDQGREREWLVTYRSLATTVKYVYPFMTPVSDLGEQKKRMERIRSEVGWRRVGCEIEGYCANDL